MTDTKDPLAALDLAILEVNGYAKRHDLTGGLATRIDAMMEAWTATQNAAARSADTGLDVERLAAADSPCRWLDWCARLSPRVGREGRPRVRRPEGDDLRLPVPPTNKRR